MIWMMVKTRIKKIRMKVMIKKKKLLSKKLKKKRVKEMIKKKKLPRKKLKPL